MDWTDFCVDQLIGGRSLNLVGLDGSGRSTGLHQLAGDLDSSDWSHVVWSFAQLVRMSRREMRLVVDSLIDDSKIPVLLIDDFGEFVMTPDGGWLERMLFSRVFAERADDRPSLRCVVVTHPRDREIVGPGSGLRERARHIHPPERTPTEQEMADFACAEADELLLLTGYNHHLLSVSGDTPVARRGTIRLTAQKWLPRWIGQLDTAHQGRLRVILDRRELPRWRRDDADPSLTPIVVPIQHDSSSRCAITKCIDVKDLRALLVGQPWPEHDLGAAVRRFCARCGSDPAPLWVDNYLSDTQRLDFSQLVEFLEMCIRCLPGYASIRVLSRNWVDGRRVDALDILTALQQAGISSHLENRIHWRLYDQRSGVNLHRRELILSTRRTAFTLPPALILIGQDSAGNETDAEVAITSSASTATAWKKGIDVIGGGRSSR